jgi:hypothetical protein
MPARARITSPLVASIALVLSIGAATAAAQQPADPPPVREPRLRVGIDASALFSPKDDLAFFNFTDYEHNALRVARLRLLSEWRAAPRLSVVAELRTEDGDGVDVAALYARWRPWSDRAFTVQAGRVPPVIGALPRRAYGSSNLVLGTPLAYQYLTSLRPDALPANVAELLGMRGRGWQPSFSVGATSTRAGLPLVSMFRWDSGVQVSWRGSVLELAGAVTQGAPARPIGSNGRRPGWSGRAAVHLPSSAVLGVSAARGHWIDTSLPALAALSGRASSTQTLLGADAEYGLGRWLIRGEWLQTSFALPLQAEGRTIPLGAWSAFAEGRCKITTRWSIATRVERLRFSTVTAASRGTQPWDAGVDRVEAVASFRLTRTADVKAGWQHNWRDGGRVRERGFPVVGVLWWY